MTLAQKKLLLEKISDITTMKMGDFETLRKAVWKLTDIVEIILEDIKPDDKSRN